MKIVCFHNPNELSFRVPFFPNSGPVCSLPPPLRQSRLCDSTFSRVLLPCDISCSVRQWTVTIASPLAPSAPQNSKIFQSPRDVRSGHTTARAGHRKSYGRPAACMAGAPATADAVAVPLLLPLDDAAAGGRGCWEDGAISLGLVGVQLAGAAYMVVVTPVLALGLDPLFLVAFGSLCTAVLTIPFAVKLERKKWPSELTSRLLFQFVVLALGGVTGFQALLLQGMKMTSPAIASAMPNLAPGFIFVISGCLGFERVDLKCRYTRAKILGTVVCLGGAVAMSVLQSPDAPPGHLLPRSAARAAAARWVAGCLFLLGAVLVLSGTIVMQAATMLHFPAPFTLCSVTSLIGAAMTAAFQVATAGRFSPGTPQISLQIVLSLVFVGGVVSSACIMFQTWALEKKGPVMVSMFSPTQTVGTAIFSVLFLGRVMQPGSILGMVFLFSGLYVVLWAKKKEGQVLAAERKEMDGTANNGMHKPLLF